MVQITVRPPWASDFMRDTTWKQDALSRPLSRERPREGRRVSGAWERECLGWDSYYTGAGADHTSILTHYDPDIGGAKKPNVKAYIKHLLNARHWITMRN